MLGCLLLRIAPFLPLLRWLRSLLVLGFELLAGLPGELLVGCLAGLVLVELAFLSVGTALDDTSNLRKAFKIKEKNRFVILPSDL